MKTLISFAIFCLVISSFIACKKEAASPANGLPASAGTIAGKFSVNSFIDNGNQSAAFSGFTFRFNADGTIVAAKDALTFNGTWTFDDDNNTEIKIHFSEAPLDQLNKSWHISDLTADHLFLSDDGENEDAHDDHGADNSSIEFERD